MTSFTSSNFEFNAMSQILQYARAQSQRTNGRGRYYTLYDDKGKHIHDANKYDSAIFDTDGNGLIDEKEFFVAEYVTSCDDKGKLSGHTKENHNRFGTLSPEEKQKRIPE